MRYRFLEDGRYLVICNNRVHSINDWMFGFGSNSLDVYIGYLRRKTEEGGKSRLIQTIRGVGYALRET